MIPKYVSDNRMTNHDKRWWNFVTFKNSPLEKLTVIAFTHKNFYLTELGKLVVEKQQLQDKLHALLNHPELGIEEAFYLSTCNRVEFIVSARQQFGPTQTQQLLETFYDHFAPAQLSNMAQFAKLFHSREALAHLFQVSCSMDSMVIGEREITRQIRQAYEDAVEMGTTGDFLRLVMKQTIKTAKEVYTETRIAEKPISVASVAVRKLIDFNFSEDAPIAIIGAGETNTLVGKYLKKAGFYNFSIFNRTFEKAQQLANYIGGRAYALDQLPGHTEPIRVIFSCTASNEPVLTDEIWQKIKGDGSFPVVIIDLAVPNDVAAEVQTAKDVVYISMDVLKTEVEKNLVFRAKELEKADQLIQASLDEFNEINRIRNVEKALSDFPVQVKEIKNKAMQEVFNKELQQLDPETLALVERMMAYMEKKCISVPIVIAKNMLLQNDSVGKRKKAAAIPS